MDVNSTCSSRSLSRGIALVDSDCCQRGLSETIRSQRWACFRMRSTRRPRTPVPLAVLTRLVATGGDGRSSGCELAVEHGSRARVRSETGQTIAGSFVVYTRRTGWVAECTLSLTEAFPSASLITRRRAGPGEITPCLGRCHACDFSLDWSRHREASARCPRGPSESSAAARVCGTCNSI